MFQHSEKEDRRAKISAAYGIESDPQSAFRTCFEKCQGGGGERWKEVEASSQPPESRCGSQLRRGDFRSKDAKKSAETTERADLLVLPVADTQGCRTDWLTTVEM